MSPTYTPPTYASAMSGKPSSRVQGTLVDPRAYFWNIYGNGSQGFQYVIRPNQVNVAPQTASEMYVARANSWLRKTFKR